MDYKSRQWLDEWSGAHIVATIVDGVPDLDISDGEYTAHLCQYGYFDNPDDPTHQRNLAVIRALINELVAFHAAYMAALGDTVTTGAGVSVVTEVKCSE